MEMRGLSCIVSVAGETCSKQGGWRIAVEMRGLSCTVSVAGETCSKQGG